MLSLLHRRPVISRAYLSANATLNPLTLAPKVSLRLYLTHFCITTSGPISHFLLGLIVNKWVLGFLGSGAQKIILFYLQNLYGLEKINIVLLYVQMLSTRYCSSIGIYWYCVYEHSTVILPVLNLANYFPSESFSASLNTTWPINTFEGKEAVVVGGCDEGKMPPLGPLVPTGSTGSEKKSTGLYGTWQTGCSSNHLSIFLFGGASSFPYTDGNVKYTFNIPVSEPGGWSQSENITNTISYTCRWNSRQILPTLIAHWFINVQAVLSICLWPDVAEVLEAFADTTCW